MKYVLFAACVIVALSAFLLFDKEAEPSSTPHPPSLSTIEIADTPEKRSQGLSGRDSLPEGYGMLFVFPEAGNYGFWMKDMLISIDIIWLADSYEILGIEHSVSPDTYPKAFYPPKPVRYVLEIPAGFAHTHGWEVGTTVTLPSK